MYSKSNLNKKRRNPNAEEKRVRVQSCEDVALAVQFARVDFVEERHENKRREEHSKMLSRRRSGLHFARALDVKQRIA